MGATLHSLVVFAAAEHEKSETLFFIAGGILVAWAIILFGLGMTRPDFPGSGGAARGIMAVSAVLVIFAVIAGVTSSTKKTTDKAEAKENTKSLLATTPEPPPPGQPAAAPADTTSTPAPTTSTPATTTSTAAAAPAAAGPLTLAASATALAYDKKTLEAKAGKVTIDFSNPGQIPHDVVIAQGSKQLGGTKQFTAGKQSFDVTLKAGTYQFFCDVPGHRQSGMEGTLTIT